MIQLFLETRVVQVILYVLQHTGQLPFILHAGHAARMLDDPVMLANGMRHVEIENRKLHHSLIKKYYAKVRLPEGKTFEQATGHEKTGTLQDWIQFEPKENKSCVIEQKQRENEREDIRHPADGKRSQLQKPRHTATSQNKIQEAVLDYQVIRQGEGSALLDITLHTGRHHQIRVQLAHLGTPICGDHKYGKAERGTPALCSYHIDFVHPVSGKEMTYEISPRNFETEC